jgi:hypothetical protein
MQIVHVMSEYTMRRDEAVFSVLFEHQDDGHSSLLQALIDGTDFPIDTVGRNNMSNYYAYLGSATVPSCLEVVNWFVSSEV